MTYDDYYYYSENINTQMEQSLKYTALIVT